MKNLVRCALALSVPLFFSACGGRDVDEGRASPADAADTVFVGGPIYTGLSDAPTVEAVAVKDGRIVAAGRRAD
ncbi:MAG: hypothetical protein HXY21_14300, partial [Parvularculaceae bacterium]|nr:hypothetical protein [Parvularculaceae bacterium]